MSVSRSLFFTQFPGLLNTVFVLLNMEIYRDETRLLGFDLGFTMESSRNNGHSKCANSSLKIQFVTDPSSTPYGTR
jgi:hypothetical protein